ncbi:hypothetical protein DL98DRAFT_538714 [Cadophora sp. DSE1049]|nr:hypothetical protein DL98DRAFT_538714 [Cadophora sp. DSE1049]
MNPNDQQSQSPSMSTQSSSASPHRSPGSQNHGSASGVLLPKPGSLLSSWDPRVREKEAEQERLERAAEKAKMASTARKSQPKVAIEISDDEETTSTDTGASEFSFQGRPRAAGFRMLSESAELEPVNLEIQIIFFPTVTVSFVIQESRSESPSLFLPEREPRVNATPQVPTFIRPLEIIEDEDEPINLLTPSPPRQRPTRPTFSTSATRPRSSNTTETKIKKSSVGRKRSGEREIAEESPSKRHAHNTLQAGGVSRALGRTKPGTEIRATPREQFLGALRDAKAKDSVIEKVMELYDRFH